MKKILFLCTANSCRSQMAEGLAKQLFKDKYEIYSAGSNPSRVDSKAVEVLREIGIDISNNRSKHLDEFLDKKIDLVITVCDNAKESCPIFTGAKKMIHKGFPDPPALGVGIAGYRNVRDEILEFIKTLPQLL
ncbi:MAG: arsenate reductase ArsC [Candidatus Muiribacteriota bacterium]